MSREGREGGEGFLWTKFFGRSNVNLIQITDTMKSLTFAFMLAISGCAHDEKSATQSAQATEVHSPYERYLPQTPPAETNRVKFLQGYSIVSPGGWVTREVPMTE